MTVGKQFYKFGLLSFVVASHWLGSEGWVWSLLAAVLQVIASPCLQPMSSTLFISVLQFLHRTSQQGSTCSKYIFISNLSLSLVLYGKGSRQWELNSRGLSAHGSASSEAGLRVLVGLCFNERDFCLLTHNWPPSCASLCSQD